MSKEKSNVMTREAYEAILTERSDIISKLKNAAQDGDQFLQTHYTGMLRACEKTYHKAIKANVTLEHRELREEIRSSSSSRRAED